MTATVGRQAAASGHINFALIARRAQPDLLPILRRWLPQGRIEGHEYVALNPRRQDRHLGSFRINLHTQLWADFALSDARGRDVISLAAYLFDLNQFEAARGVAQMIGMGELNDARS
jgi:hypothetical protein